MRKTLYILILILCSSQYSNAFDSKVDRPYTSFWKFHYNVPMYSTLLMMGMAVYEGTENRLGKTAWESLDAGIISQIATESLKMAGGRLRPRNSDSPNQWFEGGKSFPSGHVAGMTALVTPFVLEYAEETPMIHLLWLLPLYQMEGRLRAQAHWQTDVLAGAAVGLLSGYWAHQRDNPLILYFDTDKVVVGLKYKF